MVSIFSEGLNCWRDETADYLSVIVDYGNYYRNLRESIIHAQHSIFILGWDIDSRIELLRGHDARVTEGPIKFFDLICWKAKQNPEVQIYLNRWNYSMFFMRQREPFWIRKWKSCDLPNIHVCMDDVVPLSACHHQKIAVIDDQVAYWGGMDIALGRWDMRQHHVQNDHRADPAELLSLKDKKVFAPYHDVQAVMAGPAARAMGEWVRIRWHMACAGDKPVAMNPAASDQHLPSAWPSSDPPDFTNVNVALARTIPTMQGINQTEEIIRLFLDEIAQAEYFIYIENQFLACNEIAEALNRRMCQKPDLKILAVSCFDPSGIFERLSMWGGRVRFKDTLIKNGVAERVAMAYPVCRENDDKAVIRVHSKIIIIDDKYMHIGSSNINNRSMGMDTEFDVSLYAEKAEDRKKIADIRNDLICEHTGYKPDVIEDVIHNGNVGFFLTPCEGSRQSLQPIDDEAYRNDPMASFVCRFADPRRPLVPARFTRFPRLRKEQWFFIAAFFSVIAFFVALWTYTPLATYADTDRISSLLSDTRESPAALLWTMIIYIVAGLFFFPVTTLSTAVVLIFGGIKGFVFATIGALASGMTGYFIGRLIGRDHLIRFFPTAEKAMQKIRGGGVIGVTVIRMIPIAPFSMVNMVMGVIHMPILAFLIGTALGLSPGKVVLAFFGDDFIDVFRHPNVENIFYTVLGFFVWITVVITCNKLAKHWQMRRAEIS